MTDAGNTVLVIEDNPLNMELVVDLLEVAGYRVLQASCAEEGIDMARRQPPDLILMDISLPGMDGLTATRILKEEAATQRIPVVALTAYAMHRDEAQALAAGCAGYITKPIDTTTFARKVAGFLSGSS